MSYRNKTYVAFDGDNDMWAYRLMQAWKANEHIDFDFHNAHDLNSARDSSQEESIKAQLRIRMANSKQMVLLVGTNTKYLHKFVAWEIELARKKDLPIIVVNLNKKRTRDTDFCPKAVGDDVYTLHVAFYRDIIKYALDEFPDAYAQYKNVRKGPYYYPDSVYKKYGL